MTSSKNGPFSAVNFSAVKRKVLLFLTGVLILFIVLSLLFGIPFLWRLTEFYAHGGEQLLAHLASYNIRFREPTLDNTRFETFSCISQDGDWGSFTLYWDPDEIKDTRESLLNQEKAKQKGYIKNDLFYVVRALENKSDELDYSFFLNGDRWGLSWTLYDSDIVAAERLENLLVTLTDEKRPLPYRWRVEYYDSIILADLEYLRTLWSEHPYIYPVGIVALITLPKPVILSIWYRLFALFSPGALKMVLYTWSILMAAALAGTIMIYRRLKHDPDI